MTDNLDLPMALVLSIRDAAFLQACLKIFDGTTHGAMCRRISNAIERQCDDAMLAACSGGQEAMG